MKENDVEDLIARVTLLDKIVKENSEYTKLKILEMLFVGKTANVSISQLSI